MLRTLQYTRPAFDVTNGFFCPGAESDNMSPQKRQSETLQGNGSLFQPTTTTEFDRASVLDLESKNPPPSAAIHVIPGSETKRRASPFLPHRSTALKRRRVSSHRRPKKLPLAAINALSVWLSVHGPHKAPTDDDLYQLSSLTGLKPKRVARCLEDIRTRYRTPLESYLMSSSEAEAASETDIGRELERRMAGACSSSALQPTATLLHSTVATEEDPVIPDLADRPIAATPDIWYPGDNPAL